MNKKIFDLATLQERQLPIIRGIEEKQKELVKSHPFIEIKDATTETEAKKNRTALRGGRIFVQSGDKAINAVLLEFRNWKKEEIEKLVNITLPHEQKQQEELDKYAQVKQEKKEEKERLARERVEKINMEIDGIKTTLADIIDNLTFESIEDCFPKFFNLIDITREAFDFEERLQFFEMMVERKKFEFEKRIDELKRNEQLRLDNIQLKEDAEAAKIEQDKKDTKAAKERKKLQDKIDADKIKQDKKDAIAEKEKNEMAEKLAKFEKAEKEKKEAEETEKLRLKKIDDDEKARLKKIKDDKKEAKLLAEKKRADVKRQKELKPQKDEAIRFLGSFDFDDFEVESNEINKILKVAIEAFRIHQKGTIQLIEKL